MPQNLLDLPVTDRRTLGNSSRMGILGNPEESLRNRMDQGIPGVQSWSSRFVSDFSLALATNE
eukprot:COSAG02_NODE_27835_length_601_cov_1.478088_1_plen_62_part_01